MKKNQKLVKDLELFFDTIKQLGTNMIGLEFLSQGLLRFDNEGNEIPLQHYIKKYHNPDEKELNTRKFYKLFAEKLINNEYISYITIQTEICNFNNIK